MKTHSRVTLFVLLVSVFACRPPAKVEETDPMFDRISPIVERLRGLEFKRPVRVGHVTSADVKKYLEKRIREEYTPDELLNERRVLVLLKLLPEAFPYEETVVSMLTQEIAGFYDPDVKTLFLSDLLPKAQIDSVLVHELTHALQDQYFDIGKLMKRKRGNDDENLALSSLFEGEAMAVMMSQSPVAAPPENLLRQAMTEELKLNPSLRNLPKFMIETMVFPYVEGLRFVTEIRRNGGWESVDGVYSRLPVSTAQVLHPSTYVQPAKGERPIGLEFPDVAVKPMTSNVMGEFGVREVFEARLGADAAKRAAEGWKSDRYWLIQTPGKTWGLVWKTEWASGADAAEFEKAFRSAFPGPGAAAIRKDRAVEARIGISAAL